MGTIGPFPKKFHHPDAFRPEMAANMRRLSGVDNGLAFKPPGMFHAAGASSDVYGACLGHYEPGDSGNPGDHFQRDDFQRFANQGISDQFLVFIKTSCGLNDHAPEIGRGFFLSISILPNWKIKTCKKPEAIFPFFSWSYKQFLDRGLDIFFAQGDLTEIPARIRWPGGKFFKRWCVRRP